MQQTARLAGSDDDDALRAGSVASALVAVFRGRFCDILLPGRVPAVFERDAVIYELGDEQRVLYFLTDGVVKTGTITSAGREIIYDLRKAGDVVGELCALDTVRRDRAVALERTEAIPVPYDQVMDTLARHPALLRDLLGVFGNALSEAYDQVDGLAATDMMHRLLNVLKNLAQKFGRPLGEFVEIAPYLTQEELAQMVVARRERVSTALNVLRRRGTVQYSSRGHLLVDLHRLERDSAASR